MKKSLTILALACVVTGANAQDLTSKKGEQILPEAGDWSIGVNANPFLEYMGNFFGKSANNTAPTFSFLTTNQTITGKYFTEAQMAYRASLRIGFGGNTQRAMVDDRAYLSTPSNATVNTYPTITPQVENSWKHSTTNIGLAVGMEKRKGKTRLQGFYGAELGLNLSSSKDVFEYGNTLKPQPLVPGPNDPNVDVDPTDDAFSGSNNIVASVNTSGNPTGRITERKNGTTFTFGLRAFIGVEYFMLPKISLGGEFGWGLGLRTQGKSTTTIESVGNKGGGAADEVGTTTVESSKNGGFALDTDNTNSIFGPSAQIRLNFHF